MCIYIYIDIHDTIYIYKYICIYTRNLYRAVQNRRPAYLNVIARRSIENAINDEY